VSRVWNFSAGPAALPQPVLERAQRELLDWNGSGASVMEQSHRGKRFIAMAAKVEADLRELMGIPPDYAVLFEQGGATQHFAQIPMNLAREGESADYIVTGHWSEKAASEASTYVRVNVAATSKADNYLRMPARDTWKLDPAAAYVHIATNETIHGVEFQDIPDVGDVPLVADMSSDILSGPVDVSRFGLIYAGAPDGEDLPLRRTCRQRFDAKHTQHLGLVSGRIDLRVVKGKRRPQRHGRAQSRQGHIALQHHRRFWRLLPQSDRSGRALAHECALHFARQRA
jgi:hypothetical protein